MSEKVQVKITRNTVAEQKPVKIGDVLMLDAREATTLINMKRAVVHTEDDEQPEPENTPAPAPAAPPIEPPAAEKQLSKKAQKKAAAAAKAAAEAAGTDKA